MSEGETERLAAALDGVLEALRRATGASRCTIRFDDPARGWHVDDVVAEARTPETRSMRGEGAIDQRAGRTVMWLAANRRPLVQPDLSTATDPVPPEALKTVYGATAQMLTPLLDANDYLQGWISVHYTAGPQPLGPDDEAALARARTAAAGLLGLPPQ